MKIGESLNFVVKIKLYGMCAILEQVISHNHKFENFP